MRLIFLPVLVCTSMACRAQTPPSQAPPSRIAFVSEPYAGASPSATTPSNDTTMPAAREIVPPKLIHALAMKDDGNHHVHIEARRRVVLVELTVNEHGEPTNLHVAQPIDNALEVELLATIGKFRYEPGTINGRAVPVPIRMHYVVPVGAIY